MTTDYNKPGKNSTNIKRKGGLQLLQAYNLSIEIKI
jgi:hypothetical protein